jgi:hypothetical protein
MARVLLSEKGDICMGVRCGSGGAVSPRRRLVSAAVSSRAVVETTEGIVVIMGILLSYESLARDNITAGRHKYRGGARRGQQVVHLRLSPVAVCTTCDARRL